MAQVGSGRLEGGGPAGAGGRFTLDRLFGMTFRAMAGGAGGFAILFLLGFLMATILGGAAFAAWYEWIGPGDASAVPPQASVAFSLVGLVIFLLYMVGFLLLHLVAVGLACAVLQGQPATLRGLFALARQRFWPALGAGILAMLGILGGTILFLVPGIILSVMWFLWSPACLLEGCGPREALRRSRVLTRGRRWTVFALWLITMLVSGALHDLAQRIADWQAVFAPLVAIAYGFTSIFWACLVAAVYLALRETEAPGRAPDPAAAQR